jgi:hypothetical protein
MTTWDPDRPVLLHGGAVFTATDTMPWTQAVVFRGQRILAVGTVGDLDRRYPGALNVDVGGRTVVPGFIDAHNHFLATGESLASVELRFATVPTTAAVISTLAEAARATPPGEWVVAFGYDDAKYHDPLDRDALDSVSVSHPIRVHHVSGHHVCVNSLALQLRGVTESTPDPQGGRLVRDAAGRLTGQCLDAAMNLILPVSVDIGAHGPNFHTSITVQESVAAVERAGRAFLAAGLTTVCDAQVTQRELLAYREARRVGRLPLRTVCMPLSHQLDELVDLGLAGPFGDDRLSIGAMKFYADGSLIGGTASFAEPYGAEGQFTGSMYWEPAQLTEMIVRAHLAGWQVGVHVQGDHAMGAVLDAIETAVDAAPRDHRHRLEHAGYPTPEQITRIAELGIITVNQPSYLHDSGDEFLDRLGDRAHLLVPLRAELDARICVVLSSDSDVASYRPLDTVRHAIARTTSSGAPIGPGQALTLDEALRAHTLSAACALRMEDRIGSLEPGKLADLVIIDADLTTTDPRDLSMTRIWATVLDGQVEHAFDPASLGL